LSPYKILQVDPEAEQDVIEAAYRRLASKYHPDKDRSENATRRMQQINAAFDILRDPERRARHDREEKARAQQARSDTHRESDAGHGVGADSANRDRHAGPSRDQGSNSNGQTESSPRSEHGRPTRHSRARNNLAWRAGIALRTFLQKARRRAARPLRVASVIVLILFAVLGVLEYLAARKWDRERAEWERASPRELFIEKWAQRNPQECRAEDSAFMSNARLAALEDWKHKFPTHAAQEAYVDEWMKEHSPACGAADDPFACRANATDTARAQWQVENLTEVSKLFSEQQSLTSFNKVPEPPESTSHAAIRPPACTGAQRLVLATAHAAHGRPAAALDAFRQAVLLDRGLAKDQTMLRTVRAAAEDAETHYAALTLAAELLGEEGADILFEVSTHDAAPGSLAPVLASGLLAKNEVRAHASKALAVLLMLRDVATCEDAKRLLPSAIESADERSGMTLVKLSWRADCDLVPGLAATPAMKASGYCFPCLRGDKNLAVAISSAMNRKAPKYMSDAQQSELQVSTPP
jgi:curved DNA-binding protein CbpA